MDPKELRKLVLAKVSVLDSDSISLKSVRSELEQEHGVSLFKQKNYIKEVIQEFLDSGEEAGAYTNIDTNEVKTKNVETEAKTKKDDGIDKKSNQKKRPAPEVEDEQPRKEAKTVVSKNENGEEYINLDGRLKRVTVRKFKGVTYIDFREFYNADGDQKPTKKGISLSKEAWVRLKGFVDDIDGMIENINK
ncbi:activated RNA polymerase II transcriptional coactivator p15 [Acrasis kona]|uniref:Activated RNA polymerase II transcriptional coactivator p15 n=1 Tax=Acrasis kona TaxID=1008807 RepID=A0AAW2YXI5_9EUKA